MVRDKGGDRVRVGVEVDGGGGGGVRVGLGIRTRPSHLATPMEIAIMYSSPKT